MNINGKWILWIMGTDVDVQDVVILLRKISHVMDVHGIFLVKSGVKKRGEYKWLLVVVAKNENYANIVQSV